MSLNTILLDPTIYDKPYTFNPERWLSGSPTELTKLNNYLVPFGRGARMCVGQKYALSSPLPLNFTPWFSATWRICKFTNPIWGEISFARTELLICTAILFRRFAFELVDVDRVRDIDVKRDCFLGQPGKESKGLRVRVKVRDE